jgi:ABC-type antimicrobial peptide transport system permease subunit
VLLVHPSKGVSASTLARRILAAKIDPDLHALSPGALTRELSAELASQVALFSMLQAILLFVALVATLSTLLLVGVQRRRELGILGAVGFGPRGLALMTLSEAAVMGVLGSTLGVVASVWIYQALRNVSLASIGTTAPFAFDVRTAVVATALGIGVVAAGGVLPAWRTSRLEITDAIREE